MSVSSSAAVRAGQILAQRYRIQRLLGEGAVGSVFAAEDLELGRLVAIKVLKTSPFDDRFAMERFRREIHATMRIECEYIVRTLGVDHLENGAPFMVMEYLDARDVSKAIAESGPLSVEKAIEFTLQICLALAHAHRIGIVHRDIKPANLLLVRQPNGHELVKVLDFGISKIAPDSCISVPPKLTGNAVRLGSPMYMSPEQRTLAREVDERTDIWSLGITLFEMIAGVVPFDSTPQSIRGQSEAISSVPSLSRYRPGIPQGLDLVISRCLQRMPAFRFQNVAELAGALGPFAVPQVGQLCGEVANALGTPRYSTAQRSAAASLGRGFNVEGIGPGTTLGPAIAPPPATIRTEKRHNGTNLWWLVAVPSLGVLLAVVVASYLYKPQQSYQASTRVFATMPVYPAWTHRARSWDQRLLNRPASIKASTLPQALPASSLTNTSVPDQVPSATPSAALVPAEPSASTSEDPAPGATVAAPPTTSVPFRMPDLGY